MRPAVPSLLQLPENAQLYVGSGDPEVLQEVFVQFRKGKLGDPPLLPLSVCGKCQMGRTQRGEQNSLRSARQRLED